MMLPSLTTPWGQSSPIQPHWWRISPYYEVESMVQLIQLDGTQKITSFQFTLSETQLSLLESTSSNLYILPAYLDALYLSAFHFINQQQCSALLDNRTITKIVLNSSLVFKQLDQSHLLVSGKPDTAHPINISQPSLKLNTSLQFVRIATETQGIAQLSVLVAILKCVPIEKIFNSVERPVCNKILAKSTTAIPNKFEDELADIIQARASISLMDPHVLRPIKTPVRTRHCIHKDAWDLMVFLRMNQQCPTWHCPHCHYTLGSATGLSVTTAVFSPPLPSAFANRLTGLDLGVYIGFPVLPDLYIDSWFSDMLLKIQKQYTLECSETSDEEDESGRNDLPYLEHVLVDLDSLAWSIIERPV